MAGQKFTLTFDANLNVSQMKGALGQIQSALNGLHLPQNITKGLQGSFDNLSKEIQNFEAALSKDITSKADFNKLNKQAEKITSAFEKLKLQVKDITGLSNKDLERLLPSNIIQNINKATKAMDQYDKSTTKAANEVKEIQTEVEKLNQKIANTNNKTPITDIEWKQLNTAIKEASNEVEQYKTALANAEENQRKIASSLKEPAKSKTWREARDEVTRLKEELEKAKAVVKELSNRKATSITFTKQAEDLNKFNTALAETQTKLQAAQQALAVLQSGTAGGGLKELTDQVSQLTGLDLSNFKGNIEDLRNVVRSFAAGEVDKLKSGFDQVKGSVDNATPAFRDLGDAMRQDEQNIEQLDARMRDVSALKSRIQYFFGLNNTINLFRNAVRGAYETIKELDKAMTETAVVTNFSVGDMWKQLPEYTKRANELGVTTKAAYEAATLYYQQGLTTEEVNALSVETLKMARIAGLDAAEATDRMTNALRGFNMELNEINAQRVDDVYSKLAAISASNVDEISTAMTKVASLAHNAGMEFETTAAFLAQIIETTRESAETAGTALKTVVARFTEVKKLVNEGELKGQDDEGELIDVNKVSAALRTAGIDLNRYFLGEVGIDDIFMELAEKWDSLTSLQQRYIATQAAGSRQQSRFIALLSDYARTQELVGAAYNANGAAAEQFGKTQESLESKLARLKNAWNEFLMGLTNNTVVKAGVDLLTNLLNIINKLTSAFGDGAGSIMKWMLAIGTLRGMGSLFAKNGGLEKALGLLTGGKGLIGGIGQGVSLNIGKALSKSLTTGLGSLGSAVMAGAAQGGTAGILGKVFGGAAGRGAAGLGASGGTAAIIAGIASALTAVAAAAGVAAIAYQGWLKLTDQGQLKTAKKNAETLNEQAKELQQSADSIKNLQESYNQYTEELKNASTISDRESAIKARNDAILKAIEKNPDYAQYLNSDFEVNGELVLTLDENKVTEAATQAAADATSKAIDAYFADADVALREAKIVAKRQEGHMEYYDWNAESWVPGDQTAATESLRRNYLASAENQARLAYSMMLNASDIKLDSELSNQLVNTLGKIFIETGEALNEVNIGELQRSLSDGTIQQQLLEILNADKIDQSLEGLEIDQDHLDELDSFLELVGVSTDSLKEFEAAVNDESGVLKRLLGQQAKNLKEVQKANKARAFQSLWNNGIGLTTQVQDFINNLAPKSVETFTSITDNLSKLIDSSAVEDFYKKVSQAPSILESEEIEEIQNFFNSFNLDDPVNAFIRLRNAERMAAPGSLFSGFLKQIENVNKSVLNAGNVLQNFLISSDYEELSESVEKFIKENGRITSDNVEDLASECKALQAILDEDTITAEGLAAALTALENGQAPIEGLTTRVLEALSAASSFDAMLNDISDTIANFDEGTDYGAGSDFLVQEADKLLELIDGYEFGNEQTRNIYDLFFGQGAYDKFMRQWGTKGIDQYAAEMKAQVEQLKGWADNNSYGFMRDFTGQLGIEQIGDYDFKWDAGGKTTEELIDEVVKQAGINRQTAEMIIAGFAAQSYNFASELKENDYSKFLEDFVTTASESSVITQQELEAIGGAYGKTAAQVEQDMQKISSTKDVKIPTVVDWTGESGEQLTGESLAQKFTEQMGDFATYVQDALTESGNIDANAIMSKLMGDGLSEGQANEIAAAMAEQLNKSLETEVSIPHVHLENGAVEITQDTIKVTSDTMSGLTSDIQQALADVKADVIGQAIVDQDPSGLGDKVLVTLQSAGDAGAAYITTTIDAITFNPKTLQVDINYNDPGHTLNITDPSGGSAGSWVNIHALGAARGGFVKALANGSADHFIQPGWALTGEEGSEIVWNKYLGYAYVTGSNGPEFRTLNPGDRVFNAQETQRIFRNTKFSNGNLFGSYATGGYNPNKINAGGSGSGSSSSGGKDKSSAADKEKETKWKNEIDWLYNLVEDIEELERKQTKLQEDYEDYLQDETKAGKDLYNLLVQQLGNLYTQLNHQEAMLSLREREMREFMDTTNQFDNLLWYNWNDRTLEIDWDQIEAIQDKDTYDKVSDLVSEAESIQKKIDDADDSIMDIKNQIQELENIWRDTYVDFESRVFDAIVSYYQQIIDNYSELHDTLSNSNSAILNAIQKQIALERQIRDNTQTEENISDAEAQLAFLRRDTTGGNELASLQLQKELSDQRQSYEDTLIDQAISRLQDDNEAAAEQRQKQIEIMQAQLDYQQQNGEFNAYVRELLESAMGADGELLTNSDLMTLLKDQENWSAMSEVSKQVWEEELNTTFKEVAAFILKQHAEENGTFISALTGAIQGMTAAIGSKSQPSIKIDYGAGSGGGGGGGGGGSGGGGVGIDSGRTSVNADKVYVYTGGSGGWTDRSTASHLTASDIINSGYFASGGLTSKTGPAWLDGTFSEPEYVLNARQTDAFLRLADILPSMMQNSNTTNTTTFGGVNLNLVMNVDQIASDYDVDRIADRVKDIVYNAGQYRNVNTLNFIR